MSGTDLLVETPVGEGRWLLHEADEASLWLLLGHGAGGGLNAPDLLMLARALPSVGMSVALFEQPWRRAGKKVASRPPVLDEAWLAAVEGLRDRIGDAVLAQGGRSAGARVACRTATVVGAAGVVNLAFPLHPPGKPEKSRLDELLGAGVPTLSLQGERDPFGGTDALIEAIGGAAGHEVFRVPGAAHDLKVPASIADRAEVGPAMVARVGEFLVGLG